MVTFKKDETGKRVDAEWHRFRADARRTAFTVDEFSDEDITRFNLETAGITGRDNPLTYTTDPRIDEEGTDRVTNLRTLDTR